MLSHGTSMALMARTFVRRLVSFFRLEPYIHACKVTFCTSACCAKVLIEGMPQMWGLVGFSLVKATPLSIRQSEMRAHMSVRTFAFSTFTKSISFPSSWRLGKPAGHCSDRRGWGVDTLPSTMAQRLAYLAPLCAYHKGVPCERT